MGMGDRVGALRGTGVCLGATPLPPSQASNLSKDRGILDAGAGARYAEHVVMKMRTRLLALALPVLLLGGCVTASTHSTTWGQDSGYGPDAGWARYGHVESVRETVHAYRGDPGAGAVAGAIIGSLLFGGRSPGSTMFGAVGGAMVGAAASSGQGEERVYEVFVRFDDGAIENYVYRDVLPFRVGDRVTLTPQGLMRQ